MSGGCSSRLTSPLTACPLCNEEEEREGGEGEEGEGGEGEEGGEGRGRRRRRKGRRRKEGEEGEKGEEEEEGEEEEGRGGGGEGEGEEEGEGGSYKSVETSERKSIHGDILSQATHLSSLSMILRAVTTLLGSLITSAVVFVRITHSCCPRASCVQQITSSLHHQEANIADYIIITLPRIQCCLQPCYI